MVKSAGPGKYHDGEHGLFLRVKPSGSRQWLQRIVIQGKRMDIGLGGFPLVALAEAREMAFENRRAARRGSNPLEDRRKVQAPTFAEACEQVIVILRENWKTGGRQDKIWRRVVESYALPTLGQKRVDTISTADVLSILSPVWTTKMETAKRIKIYLGSVFKWSMAQGWRTDNPVEAAIAALPKPTRVVEHMKALPHGEVAAALEKIKATEAFWSTKAALEFLAHTACRSGEVRMATWSEVDLEASVWTVPAARSKTGRPHVVPLSGSMLDILKQAHGETGGKGLVFPSQRGKVMTDNTMSKLLRENGIQGTPHGLRSSFRDWAGETGQAREVAEACLAHAVGSAVERAYARSDLLARRRVVMDQWSGYLTGDADKALRLRAQENSDQDPIHQ